MKTPMSKSTSKATVSLYWKQAWQYPILVLGTLFAIPITTLVNNFLPPLIVAGILQKLSHGTFIRHDVWHSFGAPLLWYAGFMMTGVLTWRLVDMFSWRLEANVQRNLAQHVYNHLISLSADFHANTFSGSLVSQNNKLLGSYVRIADTTVYGTLPMIWGVIFTSVILARRAPLFVLAFNIVVVLYIAVAFYVTARTRDASAQHANRESEQTGALADSLTNVMAIKSYAGEIHEHKRYAGYTKRTENALYVLFRYMMVQLNSFASFTRILQITAVVVAVVSVVNYDANIATVFLILSYSSTIADQLFNFSQSSLRNYNRSFGDASEMTKILALKPIVQDKTDAPELIAHRGKIEFKDVTFAHDGSEPIFKKLSLSIKPGEKIGLVGHSGSGKTTLTKLLLRFMDVQDGQILIDDQCIADITQSSLRKSISYVPQEPLLFHRSLAENIEYGEPGSDQATIEGVSKLAHAHEFIKKLKTGYQTLVGERGVKLSGGQRQRVAIARAMIKNAPILVLDEATSALDSESEALIQDALWKLMEGRTAIVIAHRLSTIQKMDRIIVMDDGKIVEQGSHKELIRGKGTYADLWKRQSGGFLDD